MSRRPCALALEQLLSCQIPCVKRGLQMIYTGPLL
ncbi:MAG: hypothetical protein RLZZ239_546, partial [Pseudomonadota bacterium]